MMECYFKISCPSCYGENHNNSYELEKIEAKNKTNEINKNIKKEAKLIKKQVKILLLGAGESGKTTFLKQMRILHDNGFNEQSILEYKHIIYTNIVQGMRVLCHARIKLEIPFYNNPEENDYHSNILLSLPKLVYIDDNLFLGLINSIKILWGDEGIINTFKCRSLYQISDSISYFLGQLDRISFKEYIPSQLDILNARSATKGVHELNILINNIPFQFIDVGGQRSQRNKWLSCFENITSILFLAATSEFDQVLVEDHTENRLKEAMTIFDVIINNRIFYNTSIILFLNKFDLLQEKIKTVDLSDHFHSFNGDNRNINDVKNFILHLFLDLKRNPNSEYNNDQHGHHHHRHDGSTTTGTTTRGGSGDNNENSILPVKSRTELYSHFTVAIDTENIRLIFNDVKKIILKKNLQNLMLQ